MLDERALVVGLEEAALQARAPSPARAIRCSRLVERQPAVVAGVAAAELVEVDAVHDLDAVVGEHARESRMSSGTAPRRQPAAPVPIPDACPGMPNAGRSRCS